MYTKINFKSKKQLVDAVKGGMKVEVFETGLWKATTNGQATVEGPHYPKPHTWYAQVTLSNGIITKVK